MDIIRNDVTVICGHYGTGKTNLCLNLALECAREGKHVTLIDIDTANVYFRSADYVNFLSKKGVKVIGPTYANTNVDIPALPAGISNAILEDELVIIDVGGDDVGATTLSRYAGDVKQREYAMLCVINRYRSLTTTPEEAVQIAKEIESACGIKITGLINNSHLKELTTEKTIADSMDFAESASKILNVPLIATTAPKSLSHSLNKKIRVYPVDALVGAPWEKV